MNSRINNKTLENYLKTMLLIKQETGYIRSVDVARYSGITKCLNKKDYITMNKDHFLILNNE